MEQTQPQDIEIGVADLGGSVNPAYGDEPVAPPPTITHTNESTQNNADTSPSKDSPPPYTPANTAAPPAYEESQDTPGTEPTSTKSTFSRVRVARQESTNVGDFAKKTATILLGTIGCTICIALILAIPVSMIAMGSVYLFDCPAERFIPIYLVVGGCFGAVKNLSSCAQRVVNSYKDRDQENAKTNPFDGILGCFLSAWFIAGNVWIYRTYNKWTDDPTADNFCHPTLYWYAFWLTTAAYILLGVAIVVACCGLIIAIVAAARK